MVVKTGLEPEAAAREYQVEGDNAKCIRILFGDVDDDTPGKRRFFWLVMTI